MLYSVQCLKKVNKLPFDPIINIYRLQTGIYIMDISTVKAEANTMGEGYHPHPHPSIQPLIWQLAHREQVDGSTVR